MLCAIDAEQRPADHETFARDERRIRRNRLPIFSRPVAAFEIREDERITILTHLCVATGNVPIKRNAGCGNGIIAADRDLALKCPRLSIERSAQYLEDVHYRVQSISEVTLAQAGTTSPVNESGSRRVTRRIRDERRDDNRDRDGRKRSP